ncbi:MAG: alpha-rhamnosidase [Flavobacteriaceae bacterium]
MGQESKVSINHEGKDFTQLKHAWTAQWITHPTESTLDARKFLFRRTFHLDTVPNQFVIHISADNRYRLYVNGQYMISGPSSSDINNYRYETLNIAPYLTHGKNVIAAEVVNFGEYRKAATMTFQTAFILQGDEGNPVNINTGKNSDWKVTRDHGFETIPFVSDSLRGYYAAGPGEKLISKDHPWGWQHNSFNDSKWITPKLGTVEFAVGRGFLFGSTWYLVPRTIPFMEESPQQFQRVARSTGVKATDGFIKGTGQLTIPPNRRAQILLDQSHHTIGHPILKYSGGKGSSIKITYAEALYDANWKKGNRNHIEGKHILGYYDVVFPDGGHHRHFQPFGQKTYRFVQLDIVTKDHPLVLEEYRGVYTAYPFTEKAVFTSDDPILSQIWDASWLTLRNSAVESFIDPYYEQLQYIGDTRIEAIVSLSVSGDDRLMRKAIEMFDNSRLPNGLTASRYPSYIVQIIPTYSLLWVNMIHDFHRYRNDDAFVQRFIPGMKGVLDWWIRKVDATGMPTQMEWWNFTDWASGFQNGIPDGADDGYSASIALQLVKTLQNATELFHDLGYPQEAAQYRELAQRIMESTVQHCYVPERGMFAETPHKKKYSQHTNIMAILTDALPKEQHPALMQQLLEDQSLIQTTIYYKYYLFEALLKAGMGNLYTGLLENWTNQLKLGLTTFAETDDEPRSECHAWSASPNHHFLKIIAGIRPATKHFDTIAIAPHFNHLKAFEAEMPHPKGTIRVSLSHTKNKGVKGSISLPPGTSGFFEWEGRTLSLKEGEQQVVIDK